MKLLLTSGGVTNPSIRDALLDLLGKPFEESSALCIPTAMHPMPGGAAMAARFVNGRATTPVIDFGWKSLGVLELTALPTVNKERWVPAVEEADAILAGGGDPVYLTHWMRESGFAELIPSLSETVYVGVSAGSIVMSADFAPDTTFGGVALPPSDGKGLGLVDIAIFPHVDHPMLPDNSMAEAEKWAVDRSAPAYAIDDDTAIRSVDGSIDIVSEGKWKLIDR